MTAPIPEKTLLAMLRSPNQSTTDPKRNAAATSLRGFSYGVWIASRPQGSAPEYGITIERLGGDRTAFADSDNPRQESVIDLTFFSKDTNSNRSNVPQLLQMIELVRMVIDGASHSGSGDDEMAEICRIHLETPAFQADEPPRANSDGWQSRYTVSYLVKWRGLSARQVNV